MPNELPCKLPLIIKNQPQVKITRWKNPQQTAYWADAIHVAPRCKGYRPVRMATIGIGWRPAALGRQEPIGGAAPPRQVIGRMACGDNHRHPCPGDRVVRPVRAARRDESSRWQCTMAESITLTPASVVVNAPNLGPCDHPPISAIEALRGQRRLRAAAVHPVLAGLEREHARLVRKL